MNADEKPTTENAQAMDSPDSSPRPWLIALVPMEVVTYFLFGTYVIVDSKTSVYSMPTSGSITRGFRGPKLYDAKPGKILRCSRSEFERMGIAHNTLYVDNFRRHAPTGSLLAKQKGVSVVVGSLWFGTSIRKSIVASYDIRPFAGNLVINLAGWGMVAAMLFCVYKAFRSRSSS